MINQCPPSNLISTDQVYLIAVLGKNGAQRFEVPNTTFALIAGPLDAGLVFRTGLPPLRRRERCKQKPARNTTERTYRRENETSETRMTKQYCCRFTAITKIPPYYARLGKPQ